MALWASLDDASRGMELALTPEQITELDRRFAEHQANPASARSWEPRREEPSRTAVSVRHLVIRARLTARWTWSRTTSHMSGDPSPIIVLCSAVGVLSRVR